jgi:hypothetical protein
MQFDNISVGDEVLIRSTSCSIGWGIVEFPGELKSVQKVTPTQFVAGDIRFRKSGLEIGSCRRRALPVTPELRQKVVTASALIAADNRVHGLLKVTEDRLNAFRGGVRRDPKTHDQALATLQQISDQLEAIAKLLPPSP